MLNAMGVRQGGSVTSDKTFKGSFDTTVDNLIRAICTTDYKSSRISAALPADLLHLADKNYVVRHLK
jgi:hypothetical protein